MRNAIVYAMTIFKREVLGTISDIVNKIIK